MQNPTRFPMNKKWTEKNLVLFVDSKEREIIQILDLPQTGITFDVVIGNMDVADIMLCVKLSEEEMLEFCRDNVVEKKNTIIQTPFCFVGEKRKSPPVFIAEEEKPDEIEDFSESDQEHSRENSGYCYNPVLELIQQGNVVKGKIEKDKIYVPMVAIERKRADDLGQSITGKSKEPGFVRYKDQKLRLKAFQRITGCTLMIIIEEYQNYHNSKYIGGLLEDSFRSAIVHTMIRDKIFVDCSANFFDTVRVIHKIAREIIDKQFRNFIFPRVFMAVRNAVKNGKIETPASDNKEITRDLFDKKVHELCNELSLDIRIYDGVQATEKLVGSHSQIVSIRKKDNKDPELCYQMMITCVHGISEKIAKAIMKKYENMPKLIAAYHSCSNEKKRMDLLKDIETDTFTAKGNRRKVGPFKSKQIYETLFCVTEPGE